MKTVTFQGEFQKFENLNQVMSKFDSDRLPYQVETRVYVLDVNKVDFENDISDEDFMTLAEEEGRVYTLQGFQQSFNSEEVNSHNDIIRFINQPYSNILGLDTTKRDLTLDIKSIIIDYGSFSVGEVCDESSPFLEDVKGNLTHLIEHFYKDTCEVNVYSERFDNRIDSYFLRYEELSESNLAEILDLCERYVDIQTEE